LQPEQTSIIIVALMKLFPGARRILISSRSLLILLIGVELVFLATVNNYEYLGRPDTTYYLRTAREIKGGEFFQKDYDLSLLPGRTAPPLYSFCLAGLNCVFPDLISAAHVFSIILSALTFVPLYWISRKMGMAKPGLLALMFLILNPFNVRYGGAILKEPLFTLLFAGSLLLGIFHLEKTRPGLSFVAGALCGLAYTAREIGIGIFAMLLVISPAYWLLVKRIAWKKMVILSSAISLGFIIFAFPFWLFIRVHTGQWGLTARAPSEIVISHQVLEYGDEYDTDTIPGTQYQNPDRQPEAEKKAANIWDLGKKLTIVSSKYLLQLSEKLGGIVTTGIILYCGFFLARWRKKTRNQIFLQTYPFLGIGCLIFMFAAATSYMMESRYVYSLLGLGMILGAAGWVSLVEKTTSAMPRLKKPAAVQAAMIFLLLISYFLEFDSRFFREIRHLSPESFYRSDEGGVREVAQELKQKGLINSPGKVFLDRKPFYAYYFDGLLGSLPTTYPALKEYLAAGQGDYLIADSFIFKKARPLLIDLVIGRNPPPDYKAYETGDGKVLVLRNAANIGRPPLPGARIIYSRYLPRYRRIVTIYDLKPGEQKPRAQLSLEQFRARALEAYERGYLYDAINYAKDGLAEKPDDRFLWKLLVNSHLTYFKVVDATPSDFIIADFLLTELTGYANTWLAIEPDNNEAREILSYLGQMREKQQSFRAGVLRQFEK